MLDIGGGAKINFSVTPPPGGPLSRQGITAMIGVCSMLLLNQRFSQIFRLLLRNIWYVIGFFSARYLFFK